MEIGSRADSGFERLERANGLMVGREFAVPGHCKFWDHAIMPVERFVKIRWCKNLPDVGGVRGAEAGGGSVCWGTGGKEVVKSTRSIANCTRRCITQRPATPWRWASSWKLEQWVGPIRDTALSSAGSCQGERDQFSDRIQTNTYFILLPIMDLTPIN